MNARASTAVRAMPGTLGAAALALVVGLALVLFGPPPGDLPAHLYRTELVEDGVLVWDTFWYAGHYPLAAYSLLYYFPAALLGNDVVAVVSVVASSALFASLARREWGEAARWPSLAFAVVACGSLFTGTYPYAAGLAAALGTLKALQLGRPGSPSRSRRSRSGSRRSPSSSSSWRRSPPFSGAACPAAEARSSSAPGSWSSGSSRESLLLVYPQDSEYPFFRLSELLAVVGLSAACAALALRGGPRGRTLAFFFGLWALATVVAFLVPSPIGENVTRAPRESSSRSRSSARPRRLLPAALARRARRLGRPRLHAGSRTWAPRSIAATRAPRSAAFWEPALRFLDGALDPRLPRRGRSHRRPLGGLLGPTRRLPACPRLVPADRHRPEPGSSTRSRSSRTPTAPGSLARHPLRPPARHPARARRGGARGRAAPLGALRPSRGRARQAT